MMIKELTSPQRTMVDPADILKSESRALEPIAPSHLGAPSCLIQNSTSQMIHSGKCMASIESEPDGVIQVCQWAIMPIVTPRENEACIAKPI